MSTSQGEPTPADDTNASGDTTASDTTASDTTASDTTASDDTAQSTPASTADTVRAWFIGRLPGDWFTQVPAIQVDREEITVIGALAAPDPAGTSDAERAAAAEGRIRRFREESRSRRIEIAREAEHKFRRKISWGVTCAGTEELFTTLSVPVMTRLRQPERQVLDTLVKAGVARSRSDALAWCVRLTGENADAWLARLRSALKHVEEVRDQGPGRA